MLFCVGSRAVQASNDTVIRGWGGNPQGFRRQKTPLIQTLGLKEYNKEAYDNRETIKLIAKACPLIESGMSGSTSC